MNLNIYLEDSLATSLSSYSKRTGESRNSIIRSAIKEWLSHHDEKKWSKSILKFKGHKKAIAFESLREDLLPPKDESPFE